MVRNLDLEFKLLTRSISHGQTFSAEKTTHGYREFEVKVAVILSKILYPTASALRPHIMILFLRRVSL